LTYEGDEKTGSQSYVAAGRQDDQGVKRADDGSMGVKVKCVRAGHRRKGGDLTSLPTKSDLDRFRTCFAKRAAIGPPFC